MRKLSTHIKKMAIALFYDEKNTPIITARGHNQLAEAIIEVAQDHNILLHEDQVLCTSLEQTEIGEEIPKELYLAVAEVIAFSYIITGRLPLGFRQEDL